MNKRIARKKAGYSIKQAANLLGISESYLYKIERERRVPGRETITKMQKLYNCSFEELF